MFEWAWPWVFVLLPLPWLVARVAKPAAESSAALRLPHADVFDAAGDGAATVLGTPRRWWPWIAWVLVLAALARPQWIGEPIDLPRSGRELLLAVDVSGSMKIDDMTLGQRRASRFESMQVVLGDFISRRLGDRVGLVLFGTRAYLLTPLTFDLKTVRTQLEESAIGLAGSDTAIGDALGLAVKRLRDRPDAQRVVVLLTDGVNTAGELDPRKAAQLATDNHVRVYTIGFGAERMRVDDIFGSHVVNPSADLDVALMSEIAQQTGGKFFRARDTAELAGIYREIDRLEPAADQAERYRPVKELFHLPLSLALLLALTAALATQWPARRAAGAGAT